MAPRGMLVPELIARRSKFAKSVWLALLERTNLDRADALHFTSELERQDVERLGIRARRVAVIANGVETPELQSAESSTNTRAGYVLSLGRINWKKGLDRLIRALQYSPAVHAVIAGNDEEGCRLSLERLAAEIGVADRVQFSDAVYGEAKWRLMREARAFVMPSHSENFGNAALEAMAVARPVVVTPAVGLAETVRDSGCGLVVDAEPRLLAEAMDRLWNDVDLARSMGERGRLVARRDYSWVTIAQRMSDLYQSILAERNAGQSHA